MAAESKASSVLQKLPFSNSVFIPQSQVNWICIFFCVFSCCYFFRFIFYALNPNPLFDLIRYHPDKNANNPEASERFKEIAFSYGILSDPEKRRKYDSGGFDALESEGMDMEIDLSNFGTVNTMFAALFSKLGVPIKNTISATVLEEALNGTVTVRPLPLGKPFTGKVEKQSAQFFGVILNDEQARAGLVVKVTSANQSKFKLLYFEEEANGGYGLALQAT